MTISAPKLSIQTFLNPFEPCSDSRTHGYAGPSRRSRVGRVTPPGGGSIAENGDGTRVAVTGKESLRILRVHDLPQIDVSRNFWEGSGLKIDSATTDIAWGRGVFNNKILTSARNGELILWDVHKSGTTKYERRTKDHTRSIHKMAVSAKVDSYCVTGSADGDMRVWDLRDLSKSIMRIHHPTAVRSLVFSPSAWQPLETVVGLDNGSIYRWDLRYGQRGQLDRLPVAHTGAVTTLDWCFPGTQTGKEANKGMGWLVSGGLDRAVKVWDLTSPVAKAHIPHRPTYTLHPSHGVRRVAWRPGYECELAIVSNMDYPISVNEHAHPVAPESKHSTLTRMSNRLGLESFMRGRSPDKALPDRRPEHPAGLGEAIEIWDVRRQWLAKWSITGSANDGGVTDLHFHDSHALWTQNSSGAFVQLDLREATKPIDALSRAAATWEPTGSLGFLVDDSVLNPWEVPYDDIDDPKKGEIPDSRTQQQKSEYKALGDPVVRSASQTIATFRPTTKFDDMTIDIDTFTNLARRYIFEGRSRTEICAFNAGVAVTAGHETSAQFWLLLGACLTDLIPPPASPSKDSVNKEVPAPLKTPDPFHSSRPSSQHSSSMDGYTFPGQKSQSTSPRHNIMSPGDKRTSGSQHYSSTPVSRRNTDGASALGLSRIPHNIPTSKSSDTLSQSRSRSRYGATTPLSSAASSPRHLPVGLPSIGTRRTSLYARRHSINIGTLERGAIRRPSLPSSHIHQGHSTSLTSSPKDRVSSIPFSSSITSSSHFSGRHENIGEGALDDSDSDFGSDEVDGDEESFDEDVGSPGGTSSDDGQNMNSLPSRPAGGTFLGLRQFPASSPLSRVASGESESESEDEDDTEVPYRGAHRPHDDDDGYTPSSQQSDGDSDTSDEDAPVPNTTTYTTPIVMQHRRNTSYRSRSSTVATLPAAPPPQPLVRQESGSSSRTVTPNSGFLTTPANGYEGRNCSDQGADGGNSNRPHRPLRSTANRQSHKRTISQAISEHLAGSSRSGRNTPQNVSRQPSAKRQNALPNSMSNRPRLTERRIEYMSVDEMRFRDTTLVSLRGALEELCDNGDVQMCAMVALVAPTEMKISRKRVARLLEAYLDILARLKLYTCAAYIRKYCVTEDVRKWSLVETTIYTSCGRCRKPLMRPAGSLKGGSLMIGAFSFCSSCKVSPVKCSICRLPVRTLLFQCSICHHGGHQACYRQFYLQTAMRELPQKTTRDVRGRAWQRAALRSSGGSSFSVLTNSSAPTSRTPLTEDDESASTVSRTSTGAASSYATPGASTSSLGSRRARKAKPLFGHPCAAGCGHFCWAANANPEF